MKRYASLFVFLLTFVFSLTLASTQPYPYKIIIKLKNMPAFSTQNSVQPMLSSLSKTMGIAIENAKPIAGGAYVLTLTTTATHESFLTSITRLQNRPDVIYAVEDKIIRLEPEKTISLFNVSHSQQWDEFNPPGGVNLEKAWDITRGSSDIVVGVIDDGITNNTDLNANVVPGWSFITNSRDNTDLGTTYHGTHVAGTIAANGTIFGMAPGIKVEPVQVCDPDGSCYDDAIINGIYWAAGIAVPDTETNATPSSVINLSVGGYSSCLEVFQDAVDAARNEGTTVVAAVGNDNVAASEFAPANCSGVIAVAATNMNGLRASYSNYGSTVTLAAPGGMIYYPGSPAGILSTIKNGYAFKGGTSMASPHVAGIAALLYSVKPTITPAEVRSILTTTAHSFGSYPDMPGYNCTAPRTCGAGIVDAYDAVRAVN